MVDLKYIIIPIVLFCLMLIVLSYLCVEPRSYMGDCKVCW